jgi:hypothetical protein
MYDINSLDMGPISLFNMLKNDLIKSISLEGLAICSFNLGDYGDHPKDTSFFIDIILQFCQIFSYGPGCTHIPELW